MSKKNISYRFFFNKLVIILVLFLVLSLGSIKLYLDYKSKPVSKENLQRFYEITKKDPLFYDPNMDIEFLERSVARLRQLDNQIMDMQKKYAKNGNKKYKDISFPQWRIWPEDFLSTLPFIHQRTKTFLAKPTAADAGSLLEAYEQAIKNYKKANETNIAFMESLFEATPEIKQRKILFAGSATTPEIVYNDFLLIRQNAQELQNEVERRKVCLYNGICTQLSEFQLTVDEKNIQKVPFAPLPQDLLSIDRQTETFVGPYWGTTDCFGRPQANESLSYPFYMKVHDENGKIFVKPQMSNTKFYEDYRGLTSFPAKVYGKMGITIRPHPEVNDYMCTDLRYVPTLFMEYLKDKKGITDALSQRTKIATFPYLIDHTLSFNDFLLYYPEYRKLPFDPFYLLLNRSAYALYFGTFSPGIWRLAQNPQFLLPEDFSYPQYRSSFIRYEDLIKEGFTPGEIQELNKLPKNKEVFLEKKDTKTFQ